MQTKETQLWDLFKVNEIKVWHGANSHLVATNEGKNKMIWQVPLLSNPTEATKGEWSGISNIIWKIIKWHFWCDLLQYGPTDMISFNTHNNTFSVLIQVFLSRDRITAAHIYPWNLAVGAAPLKSQELGRRIFFFI